VPSGVRGVDENRPKSPAPRAAGPTAAGTVAARSKLVLIQAWLSKAAAEGRIRGSLTNAWVTKSAHAGVAMGSKWIVFEYMMRLAVCFSSSTSNGGRPHTSSYARHPTAHTSTAAV
ncbi:hypothetical protein Vafri_1079, partial [Volvox africanus]